MELHGKAQAIAEYAPNNSVYDICRRFIHYIGLAPKSRQFENRSTATKNVTLRTDPTLTRTYFFRGSWACPRAVGELSTPSDTSFIGDINICVERFAWINPL